MQTSLTLVFLVCIPEAPLLAPTHVLTIRTSRCTHGEHEKWVLHHIFIIIQGVSPSTKSRGRTHRKRPSEVPAHRFYKKRPSYPSPFNQLPPKHHNLTTSQSPSLLQIPSMILPHIRHAIRPCTACCSSTTIARIPGMLRFCLALRIRSGRGRRPRRELLHQLLRWHWHQGRRGA